MQTQLQLHKPEKKENIKHELVSPWNFFLQIDSNFINHGLIYWFGYSMGKVKNVAWGHFDQPNNQMTITGSCQFSVRQLRPILKFQKQNNYLYVASGAVNRIDRMIMDYLNKLGLNGEFTNQYKNGKPAINRVDLMGTSARDIKSRLADLGLNPGNQEIYLDYVKKLTEVFLETIQENGDLVTKAAVTNCPNVITESNLAMKYTGSTDPRAQVNQGYCSQDEYSEICHVYFHGSSLYLAPEDERYEEEFLLM